MKGMTFATCYKPHLKRIVFVGGSFSSENPKENNLRKLLNSAAPEVNALSGSYHRDSVVT